MKNRIQALKNNDNANLEEFCVILSSDEIQEFKEYVKELIFNPAEVGTKTQKILLFYAAAVQFVILSFDPDQYLDEELVKSCDALAKTLYTFYNDINTILYTKQIKHCWKTYLKLNEIAEKVPTSSTHKVSTSRDRLLKDLNFVGKKIKGSSSIYNNYI